MNLQLLHKIDKRLAVLEALARTHGRETERQLQELKVEMEQVVKDVGKIKTKVAAIAAISSILVAGGIQWLSRFSS